VGLTIKESSYLLGFLQFSRMSLIFGPFEKNMFHIWSFLENQALMLAPHSLSTGTLLSRTIMLMI